MTRKKGKKGRGGKRGHNATPPPSPLRTTASASPGRLTPSNTPGQRGSSRSGSFEALKEDKDKEEEELDRRKEKRLDAALWPLEARQRRDRLAASILQRAHGNFFSFDDSNINAIHFAGLQRAFEGKDCAYLLIYRQAQSAGRALAQAFPRRETSKAVPPPSYWQTVVEAANAALAEERVEEEARRLSVALKIRFPWHVRAVEGCPVLWELALIHI